MTEQIKIEYCTAEARMEVMRFIDSHWRAGHIMATNCELFDFMHKKHDGSYDFLVARNGESVVGVLGLVRSMQYCDALRDEGDIWLVLWKSIGDLGVGVSLLQKACECQKSVSAIGINDKVAKLYKFLGFNVVEVPQYYILNCALGEYKIANVPAKETEINMGDGRAFLSKLSAEELRSFRIESGYRPRKTCEYLIRRYASHPIYKYDFFGVSDAKDGPLTSVLVTRKISVGASSCLRIVDWIGEFWRQGSLFSDFQALLKDENAEYVDCLNYGIDEAAFNRLGFDRLQPSGSVVIPQYFEPFERRNVVIKAAVLNPTDDEYVIFKGDSDQDRPNRRPL